MKKIIILISLLFSINSKASSEKNGIEIHSNEDLLKIDTNIVYDYLYIYEFNKCLDLSILDRIHFKLFNYWGNVRLHFPEYKKNIPELESIIINSNKLRKLPSFVYNGSSHIESITIEAFNFFIEDSLFRFPELKELYININEIKINIFDHERLPKIESLTLLCKMNAPEGFKGAGKMKSLKNITIRISKLQLYDLNSLQGKNIHIDNFFSIRNIRKSKLSTLEFAELGLNGTRYNNRKKTKITKEFNNKIKFY